MFCPKCGAELLDDSEFCENCGEKLIDGPGSNHGRISPNGRKAKHKWIIIAAAAVIIAAAVITAVILLQKPGDGDGEKQTSDDITSEQTVNTQTEKEKPEPVIEQTDGTEEKTPPQSDKENGASQSQETEAVRFSTDENAGISDIEWFLDCEISDGNGAGQIISGPGRTERISGNDNPILNGGWKAYMSDTITKPYNPQTERFFNADIETSGDEFSITMNWAYLRFTQEEQTYEENETGLFKGSWDAETGTAEAESNTGKIVFDNFYISSDHSAEYATGTYYWVSGEIERIALMRNAG